MKLSARAAALIVGVLMALLTMVVPTAANATAQSGSGVLAAPTPGTLYQLLNLQRGQCLAGQTSNRVNISGCNVTFTDQYWLLEPIGGPGLFRLRGLATSKCLAIISNGNVRVSGCVDSFADQWWRLDATGSNSFQLFNAFRGTCLAAPSANGAATSFRCEPTFADQSWIFIPR
jgi:pectinesterase